MTSATSTSTWSRPIFRSHAELQRDPHWARYLASVYHERVPDSAWPLDLSSFSFFYGDAVPAATRQLLMVPLLGRSPQKGSPAVSEREPPAEETLRRAHARRSRSAGDLFRMYHAPFSHAAMSTLWVYRYSRAGDYLGSNSTPKHGGLVEVAHCVEATNQSQFWMYHAPGSGVWFDPGRTFVVRNRCELWSALNLTARISLRGPGARCAIVAASWRVRPPSSLVAFAHVRLEACPGFWCGSSRELQHQQHLLTEQALRTLAGRGYESLQLTHTEEHAIYKFELVDLRQMFQRRRRANSESPRSCPNARGRGAFFAGWRGERPCHCDDERPPGASEALLHGRWRSGCMQCSRPRL